jgi:uncharacterized protein (TIGR00266 family)
MEYEVKGGQLPVVIVKLNDGESVFTESGGMSWMSEHMEMKTDTKGGFLKGLGRSLAGDSLFMTTYTSKGAGEIAFASSFPGDIKPMELDGNKDFICQKSSFLAATEGIDVAMHFRKKLGAGIFGGEGFILQKISGKGTAFMEFDGSIMEYELAAGEILKVDQGHIAMFESSVDFDITKVKGVKNMFLSGEGIFFATLKGPGKVWLQTMPLSGLIEIISRTLPTNNE